MVLCDPGAMVCYRGRKSASPAWVRRAVRGVIGSFHTTLCRCWIACSLPEIYRLDYSIMARSLYICVCSSILCSLRRAPTLIIESASALHELISGEAIALTYRVTRRHMLQSSPWLRAENMRFAGLSRAGLFQLALCLNPAPESFSISYHHIPPSSHCATATNDDAHRSSFGSSFRSSNGEDVIGACHRGDPQSPMLIWRGSSAAW